MTSTDPRAELLFELETSLHRRQVRNSRTAVSELLADEFLEFGSSGRVWDKTAIMALLGNETLDVQIMVEDSRAKFLAPDVALVTYVARPHGVPAASIATLRSSIWKLLGDRWQMVFHQGTRIPNP
jgi:hypothetical protein